MNRKSIEGYFRRYFDIGLDNIFWGEFHTHTTYSVDAAVGGVKEDYQPLDPARAYDYARHVQNFDFVGLSDHAEEPNYMAMTPAHKRRDLTIWESLLHLGHQHNDEREFIVFPGFEYTNTYGVKSGPLDSGSEQGFGHKNVVLKDFETAAAVRGRYSAADLRDPRFDHAYYAEEATDLWNGLERFRPIRGGEGRALTFIHTPSMVGEAKTLSETGGFTDHRTDWNAMDDDFVRNVELVSKWGSSEGPPPPGLGRREDVPQYERDVGWPLTVRPTLYDKWVLKGDQRYVLSFLGGTDNHVGRPGIYDFPLSGMDGPGAITGIIAPSLTRNDLWTGLWDRHTIANSTSPDGKRLPALLAARTGGRNLLGGDLAEHSGRVRIRVLAARQVTQIKLIVDGSVHSVVRDNVLDHVLEFRPGSRHFIYARASVREDDERVVTWTSPVYLQ